MSAHTPGRLKVRGGFSIYADDGKTHVADTCLTNSVPDNDEANARRLVACWNACEGLSTEALEAYGDKRKHPFKDLFLDMEQKENELLAALKVLVPILGEWHEENPDHVGHKEVPALKVARAAIAKVEGSK